MRRKPSAHAKARCTICRHPNRTLIERTRVAGASLDSVAAKYTVTRDALWRHMRNHVPEDIRSQYIADVPLKELVARAASEGVNVIDFLTIMRGILMREFQLCSQVHDKNGTAVLAGRLIEVLRTMASITGEMAKIGAVSITNNNTLVLQSPLFNRLIETLIRVLSPYPDARSAVVAALRELEADAADAPAMPPMITQSSGGGVVDVRAN